MSIVLLYYCIIPGKTKDVNVKVFNLKTIIN